VFGYANLLHGGDPSYKVTVVSAVSERLVEGYIATPLHTDQIFRDLRGAVDTLLVAGSVGEIRYDSDFLDWLCLQSGKARRFGSICTGTGARKSWPAGRAPRHDPLELVRRAHARLSQGQG
jgi:transcriptional regulator GlxA family with amidase domain